MDNLLRPVKPKKLQRARSFQVVKDGEGVRVE
jgi:hypothetical protein